MKKFFEKHDLFKVVAIFMVITALLTWVLRYSVFQNGELMTFDESVKGIQSIMDTSTIGIFDFNTYALLVLYYFTNVFVFVLVVYAFYKALGKSKNYKAIVQKVADLFKGKEIIFAGISMFFYALLASFCNDFIIALAFIPFTISVFAALKVDKISTLSSTFGGVLLGVLGATYSEKVIGSIINYGQIGIKYGNEIAGVIILTIIAFIVLLLLVNFRMKSKDKKELTEEKFIDVELKKKHYKTLPTVIALVITAVVIILAFIPWTSLGVSTFTELHEKITTATLFGAEYPIVFIGSQTFTEFGKWDLFTLSSFIMIALFIIKFIAGIKLDDLISGVGEGIKLAIKPAALLAMIYAILVFSVSYPVLPGVINSIHKTLASDILRPLDWFVGSFITSVFTVDMQYTASVIGGLYSTFGNESVVAVAIQSAYALAGFAAPTSAMLMLGLSTLDIKLKDYYKFIWKFLVALFVISLVIIYILLYL